MSIKQRSRLDYGRLSYIFASGDVNDIGVTLSLELDGDAADGTTN